jgi:preprotein translocase subunit SecD
MRMRRPEPNGKNQPTPDHASRLWLALAAGALAAGLPQAAAAYVGPGAGLTMLGALWAVIAAILFALAGLIIWPIRAMRRRRREAAASAAATASGDGNGGA